MRAGHCESDGRLWEGLPKLSLAMDGESQASQGCAARSAFWKPFPQMTSPPSQSPPQRPMISHLRPITEPGVYGCIPSCVYMCLPAMMTRRITTDKV